MLYPNPLLRGVFRVDPADADSTLTTNLQTLRSGPAPDGIDAPIISFVASVYDRSHALVSLDVAVQHYRDLQAKGDPSGAPALQRLEPIQLQPGPLLDAAAYRVAVDAFAEQVLDSTVNQLLLESATILRLGIQQRQQTAPGVWGNVTVKGPASAMAHLQEGVAHLQQRMTGGPQVGTWSRDVESIWNNYQRAKANPMARHGVLSGIDAIDIKHRGLRHGNLALVAGFTSHMKTTFVMNWAYKAAVVYGKCVGICSLEIALDDLKNWLAVLHTNHPTMYEQFKHLPAISVDAMLTGSLLPEQEPMLRASLDDLASKTANGEYGKIHYRGVGDSGSVTVGDIYQWADGLYRADGALDLLVIDYLGLVDPTPDRQTRVSRRGLAEFANLNQALRETKVNALGFAQGRGLATLSPFQCNREGLKEAEKNGGRYTMRALAGANEAERSSDIVYTTYLDDSLREANELSIGNIKTRRVPLLTDLLRVYADGATGLIDNANPVSVV